MSNYAKLLILAAVVLTVAGDYYLKKYGDTRQVVFMIWCILLWNACEVFWILAYRYKLPLGQATAFGTALVLSTNCIVGMIGFGERLTSGQWIGIGLAIVSAILLA